MELGANLQLGHQMGSLEVGSEVAVFGDVGQELERQQDVLVSRHGGQDLATGGGRAVQEVSRDRNILHRRRRVHGGGLGG